MQSPVAESQACASVASRVEALTGLRIFAAAAIVLTHLKGQLLIPSDSLAGIPLNQGVSFFYVLSGFILQHSYRQRLGIDAGITSLQFIALRFFRLWPCHIAVIGLVVMAHGQWVLDYFLKTYTTGQLLASVFLLQAWSPDSKVVFSLNSPAWSISVEMFFYAMFPYLCRQAIVSPLRPIYIGAATTFAWLTAIWLYMPSGNLEFLAGTNPLARILEFTVGISTYELVTQTRRRIKSNTAIELGVAGLAALLVATTPMLARTGGTLFGAHFGWWLGNCASFWVFAILIGIFFMQQGSASRLVASRPIAYLGEISFALYLVHLPIIRYLAGSAPWFHQFPLPVQVIVFTAIAVGLSALLHHVVEKPTIETAKRLIMRKRLQT
jgi:peptidoglycan/LPS O-acetylase OafA/YrhL